MVKQSSSQNGSAFVIIVSVLAVVVIGALGFVFWQNFAQSDEAKNNSIANQNKVERKLEQSCANKNHIVEVDGVFCSEDVGVEFKIPEVFKGKFQKVENYDVSEGSIENVQGNPAGKSIVSYEATVAAGQESLTLSIAKESLRSGYSSIGHALQRTYFNATDGNLYLVNYPTDEYDSATNTTKTTGSIRAGEMVPSFAAGSVKIYHGKIGDAGVVEDGYLMVIDDHLVIIKIKHAVNPMNESTIDYEKSFADLNSYIKQLKSLK
jgi:hypothetical protein